MGNMGMGWQAGDGIKYEALALNCGDTPDWGTLKVPPQCPHGAPFSALAVPPHCRRGASAL